MLIQKPVRSSFLALIVILSVETTLHCQEREETASAQDALGEGSSAEWSIDGRGNETKRNIRRFLECKGRRCEDRFPEGAQAVEDRSPEFKEVWDTLANSENTLSDSEYAERLKPKKHARR